MKKITIFSFLVSAFCLVLIGTPKAFAEGDSLIVRSFPKASISDQQRTAWEDYLKYFSSLSGCTYEDDPRLNNDLEGLFTEVASGTNTKPIMLTYRTYLNLPESVSNLLEGHIQIASMDCLPVFMHRGKPVGSMMLPFEEMFDLLISAHQRGDRVFLKEMLSSASVAPIDPRWFFAFFFMHEDHVSILGYSKDELKDFLNNLPILTQAQYLYERNLWEKNIRIGGVVIKNAQTDLIEKKQHSLDYYKIYLRLFGADFYAPLSHACEVIPYSVPPEITVTRLDDDIALWLKTSRSQDQEQKARNAWNYRIHTEHEFMKAFMPYHWNKFSINSAKASFIKDPDPGLNFEFMTKNTYKHALALPEYCR